MGSTNPSARPSRRFTTLLHHRGRREVRGRDLWLHHQHQVLQVAKGGVLRLQEASEEVHPHHRMYQGDQGALCPRWLWLQAGPEECYDKTQTVVQDAPKEQCTLEPQRTCKHVTKLVPKLEPTDECVDVPKEVCTRSRTNPRKVKKPVVKKWCYVPTEESGLA